MASDDGVRSTNDDAAQCKRFAVEKGYWKDPYISLFTPRGKQIHAPEINIGYYARVKGLRVFLDKFLAVSYKISILSLLTTLNHEPAKRSNEPVPRCH